MNKDIPEKKDLEDNNMRPEYDFSGGVRGKHYKDLQQGYTVEIHQSDGTTLVQHVKLEEGMVMLAPDVRRYFPDSDAVNTALRCLIPLVAKSSEPG
jgi:hypothetical protein